MSDEYLSARKIQAAYIQLRASLKSQDYSQGELHKLEARKLELWSKLTKDPNFKLGRSNLENDARLKEFEPEFMYEYEQTVRLLEMSKLQVQLARLDVDELQMLLDYERSIYGRESRDPMGSSMEMERSK